MRLLVVSSWFPYPPDNGSRLRAWHLLRELARTHAVTLLTFGRTDGREETGPVQQFCETVTVVERRTVPELGLGGLLSAAPRHFVQTHSPRMRDLIAECGESHEAVVALQVDAAFHVTAAESTLPSVVDEIEVGASLAYYDSSPSHWARIRRGLTWWKFRRFVLALSERFTRSTVVSEIERRLLLELGADPSRIAVVPNGVALGPYAPPPIRPKRVVYPGSVQYSANLDGVRYFVHEIYPLLRSEEPDLEFWITGNTDGVDVSDLRAVEGVTLTGRLPDVAAVVSESVACVVPLRLGGGTRLKVLEAMGLGTPVVSTSKGVEGLHVVPGEDVLVADDPASFATHVLRLVREPGFGDRLAVAARQTVETRYEWRLIGEMLESIIAEAVAAHGESSEART